MAGRMTSQWNQEDIGIACPCHCTNSVKAIPVFTLRGVERLVLHIAPLLCPETSDITPACSRLSGVHFLLQYVYRGARKVIKAASMIKIEMGEHNMPHVFRRKA